MSGSYQDCPTTSGSVAYGLEATGPGGTSRGQQTISVVNTATATPEATAAPEATAPPENPLGRDPVVGHRLLGRLDDVETLPGTSLTAAFEPGGT